MYNPNNAKLSKLVKWRGSLIFYPGHEDTLFIQFLARIFRLPFVWAKSGRFFVLGVSTIDLPNQFQFRSVAEQVSVRQITEELAQGELSFLPGGDLVRIAEDIATERLNSLTKSEKVYLALRHLERPAHYSEVAETYNDLFPDDQMTDKNVHAVLSRCADPNIEQYGIVWVRVKGTYALKEFGYERAAEGIHEAVVGIVNAKYQETSKPVHINVIMTELSRSRRVVNKTSLAFATGLNPGIEQVSKDYFVPKDSDGSSQSDARASELDRILRKFREDHAGIN